jgi:hypothetical protein
MRDDRCPYKVVGEVSLPAVETLSLSSGSVFIAEDVVGARAQPAGPGFPTPALRRLFLKQF